MRLERWRADLALSRLAAGGESAAYAALMREALLAKQRREDVLVPREAEGPVRRVLREEG